MYDPSRERTLCTFIRIKRQRSKDPVKMKEKSCSDLLGKVFRLWGKWSSNKRFIYCVIDSFIIKIYLKNPRMKEKNRRNLLRFLGKVSHWGKYRNWVINDFCTEYMSILFYRESLRSLKWKRKCIWKIAACLI